MLLKGWLSFRLLLKTSPLNDDIDLWRNRLMDISGFMCCLNDRIIRNDFERLYRVSDALPYVFDEQSEAAVVEEEAYSIINTSIQELRRREDEKSQVVKPEQVSGGISNSDQKKAGEPPAPVYAKRTVRFSPVTIASGCFIETKESVNNTLMMRMMSYFKQ